MATGCRSIDRLELDPDAGDRYLIGTPVRMARADLHVDRLVREDGVVLTWFVSYADEAIELRPELADGCVLRDRHTGSHEVLGPARPA